MLEMNTKWQYINWRKSATDRWCDRQQINIENKSVIIETNK